MRLQTLSILSLAVMVALVPFARAETFDTAIEAAMREQAGDFVSVPVATIAYRDTTFNLYPVEHGPREKRRVTFSGKMDVKGEKVQRVAYRVVREKNAMNVELKIDDQPWQPLSKEMAAASAKLREGGPMTSDEREGLLKSLNGALDGTWPRYVELLVLNMAMRYC